MALTLQLCLLLSAVVCSQQASLETCGHNLRECMMPVVAHFHALTLEDVQQDILDNGLESTCSTLVVASGCLQNLLQDCGSEFSLGERQGLQAIITTVDFMCVEEFDIINANRICLSSEQLLQDIVSQCGQGSSQVCRMAEDAECGINLIAERCGSQLRQVLRNYVNRLEHDIGCHSEMDFRQLLKMLR